MNARPELDAVVRGGLVFDGSGRRPTIEDLGIADGRIVARSSVSGPIDVCGDAREISADGLWVTPGFVDIHTHYDAEIEASPGLQESVRHGVTTVVMGNCSLSLALGEPEQILDIFTRVESLPRKVMERWIEHRMSWTSVGEYYDHLERDVAMGPNVASFVGHSNVRMAAMGVERSLEVRRPEPEELGRMERHVEEAMEAGYLGLSIDMLPWHRMDGGPYLAAPLPSQKARSRERTKLAGIVRDRGRVLQASPSPSAFSETSILWLAALSAGFFLRKPLKTTVVAALDVRRIPWGHRAITLLTRLANVLGGADLRFQALASPFRVYSDGVDNPVFDEFDAGVDALSASGEDRRRLFRDPEFRARFRRDWEGRGGVFHRRTSDMEIIDVPGHPEWRGRSFAEVAEELGRPPLELFMDLVVEHNDAVRWVTDIANVRPTIRRALLSHPYTLPGFSDAGAHSRNMGFQDNAIGMLREARQNPDWLSPESAVSRLTREPAQWLGLDVGTLSEGARADLVVLDPEALDAPPMDPVEQQPEFMLGAMRMVRKDSGAVRHVMIGGLEAFSAEAGFHPELGRKAFGSLLRVGR